MIEKYYLLKLLMSISIFMLLIGIAMFVYEEAIASLDKRYVKKRVKELSGGGLLKIMADRLSCRVAKHTSTDYLSNLEQKLARINHRYSASEYVAIKISYTTALILLGLMAIPISLNITMLCVLFSVSIYLRGDADLDKQVQRHNRKILREFPRFARSLRYSPKSNIISVIEDYLRASRGPLSYDLRILHAKLESGATEKEALADFVERVNIGAITNYIMAVQTALETNREDVDTLYAIQEERIRQTNLRFLREEIKNRPEKLERINMVIIYSIMGLNALAIVLSFYYDFINKL